MYFHVLVTRFSSRSASQSSDLKTGVTLTHDDNYQLQHRSKFSPYLVVGGKLFMCHKDDTLRLLSIFCYHAFLEWPEKKGMKEITEGENNFSHLKGFQVAIEIVGFAGRRGSKAHVAVWLKALTRDLFLSLLLSF